MTDKKPKQADLKTNTDILRTTQLNERMLRLNAHQMDAPLSNHPPPYSSILYLIFYQLFNVWIDKNRVQFSKVDNVKTKRKFSPFFSSTLSSSFSCSSLSLFVIAWCDFKAFRSREIKMHTG